jgi:hypothetical protein
MMVDQADNEGRGPEYTRAMVVRDQLRAYVREQRALARELSPEERAARTRYMAIFCHMGVLFGIPVFVIPMVERRDPALLKHAKAAAITFIIFHIAMIMAIGASAWWLAGLLLCYVPALAGVWSASRDRPVGWIGLGPLGELMFTPIQPRRLEVYEAAPRIVATRARGALTGEANEPPGEG